MVCEVITTAGECGRTAAGQLPNGDQVCYQHLADWIAQQLVQGEDLSDDAN